MASQKSSWTCPSNFMKCVSYLGNSFLDLIFFPELSESNPFLSGWFCMDKHRAGLFSFSSFPTYFC